MYAKATWSHAHAGFCLAFRPIARPAIRFCPLRSPPRRSHHLLNVSIRSSSVRPVFNEVEGVECLQGYAPGGYHPVKIGDVFCDRYEVVDKLGYGAFSTIWLVRDSREKRLRALKIGMASSLPQEIPVLRALQTRQSVPGSESILRLLDDFTISGPNGLHPCLCTPLSLGSLRECAFSRMFPIDVARALSYELALAVAYIHSRGIVHGDIHLGNVLVVPRERLDQMNTREYRSTYGSPEAYSVQRVDGQPLAPNVPSEVIVPVELAKGAGQFSLQDARILIADFGASYRPANDTRLGRHSLAPIQSAPPEATFQPDCHLSYPADVWSLATALWKIAGMQSLFCSGFYSDAEVICKIVDCLGLPPKEWFDNWKDRREFYDENGRPVEGRHVWPCIEVSFQEQVQKFRHEDKMEAFSSEETAAFLRLMKSMLKYNPEDRCTAQEVLQSEWMVHWA